MSIETMLTLALAGAILVVAALLRFAIRGAIRLVLLLTGQQPALTGQQPALTGQQPAGHGKVPAGHRREPRRTDRDPIWPRLARGGRALGEAIAFVASAFVEGLWIAGVGLGRGAVVAATVATQVAAVFAASLAHATKVGARRLGPRLDAASRSAARAIASAGAWLRPRIVVAIATLQHLGRVAAETVRGRLADMQEERQTRPGEPGSVADGPRVIDLDRDFDPLTDEFPEDRVSSSL